MSAASIGNPRTIEMVPPRMSISVPPDRSVAPCQRSGSRYFGPFGGRLKRVAEGAFLRERRGPRGPRVRTRPAGLPDTSPAGLRTPVPAYDVESSDEGCAMFEWSEEQLMVRDAVRKFVDTEIRPHLEELEHGDLPPYDILRKLYATFGMDAMARDRFDKRIAAREGAPRRRRRGAASRAATRGGGGGGVHDASRSSSCAGTRPGMVTAMGVSMGLTVGRDHVEGHDRAEGALGPRPAHAGEDRRLGDHRARTPAPTRSAR